MARGDRFFFYPTQTVYDEPAEHGLTYESVTFATADGLTLHGWFFPAVGIARGTIVHCHGNAGNITGHYRFVAWLPACGWNVLCFDYRGYGRSAGKPQRETVVTDVHAAIEYATRRNDVDEDRVILFGQSLGGTVALLAAAENVRRDAGRYDRTEPTLAAIAVEGAFADWREEARFVCRQTWWLWGVAGIVSRLFVASDCSALESVPRIGRIPKLFICGKRDGIVDYRQTVALHNAACEPKQLWLIEDGGHTGALINNSDDEQEPTEPNGRERFCAFLNDAVNGRAR